MKSHNPVYPDSDKFMEKQHFLKYFINECYRAILPVRQEFMMLFGPFCKQQVENQRMTKTICLWTSSSLRIYPGIMTYEILLKFLCQFIFIFGLHGIYQIIENQQILLGFIADRHIVSIKII